MACNRRPGVIGTLRILAIGQLPTAIRPYGLGHALPTGLRSFGADKKTKKKGTKEITIVGDFENPWLDLAQESAGMKAGLWYPSTDDFSQVAANSGKKNPPIVGSSEALIYLILEQPQESIKRLNIITHGSDSSIGLSGEIGTDGSVYFNEEIDVGVLAGLKNFGIVYKENNVAWEDVLSRFGSDAELVLYACKAGLGDSLLQEIANYFEVTVKAFDAELDYFVPFNQADLMKRKSIRVAMHEATTGNTAEKNGVKSVNELKPNVEKTPQVIEESPVPD